MPSLKDVTPDQVAHLIREVKTLTGELERVTRQNAKLEVDLRKALAAYERDAAKAQEGGLHETEDALERKVEPLKAELAEHRIETARLVDEHPWLRQFEEGQARLMQALKVQQPPVQFHLGDSPHPTGTCVRRDSIEAGTFEEAFVAVPAKGEADRLVRAARAAFDAGCRVKRAARAEGRALSAAERALAAMTAGAVRVYEELCTLVRLNRGRVYPSDDHLAEATALSRATVARATNRPNLVDPALLRPGRFDELIYVGVPDEEGRARILAIQTDRMPLASDVDLAAIARRTERFTGADLEDVARRAGMIALRRSIDSAQVTMADFEEALTESRASVTAEMERDYEQIAARLKQDAAAIQPIGFISPGQLTPRSEKVAG